MDLENRASIIVELGMVDEVIIFNDSDNSSCHAIHQVLHHYDSVIYANGGDRIISNIPEYKRYKNDKSTQRKVR